MFIPAPRTLPSVSPANFRVEKLEAAQKQVACGRAPSGIADDRSRLYF